MYIKIAFALILMIVFAGNAMAHTQISPKKEVLEAKAYFIRGNLKIKRIPVYKAKSLDPYLYSGSFPWGAVV